MTTSFRKSRIGDVATVNPESLGRKFSFDKILYVDISTVGTGTVDEPQEIKLNEAPSRARRLVKNGDTILSTVRPNRRSFLYIKDPKENLVVSTGFAVVRPEKVNSRYLYYVISNQAFTDYLTRHAKGSAYPAVGAETIEKADFMLPSEKEQNTIADILGTYDDLIYNNARRIQILEQTAQAIYMEWFVNFCFPGHEKVKMIDSGTDFGKIPEGWRVVKIGDIADFMNGFAFKPKHLGLKGLPIIKIPELRSGILSKTPRNSGESIPKKYLVKMGDILFSWSATLLVNIWNSGDALLNQHLFKVTPKSNNLYSYTFYLLTNQIEKYRSHAVGATMQHLRRDVVLSAGCLLPNEALLTKFEEIVLSILKEISVLTIQNQNLRQTRDLLLPKLVTGEILV